MANANDGSFVWHELMTKDPRAAIDFYGEVVGWKTQAFGENTDYKMWVGSQGPLGGVMGITPDAEKMGARPAWMGNVKVADVDATAALARKAGGSVRVEPTDIPTVGRFAVLSDPQGALIAIFKPNAAMEAHDPQKEGEFCWNELVTTDENAGLEFYGQLFGWKVVHEVAMGPVGKYRIFGVGDKQLGGAMKKPKDSPMPPMWVHYSETKDLDAAIARATKRGAKVMFGPSDVPSGGRIAQLMDPQHVVFALHSSPTK